MKRTNDSQLVFTLSEAIQEIAALRRQKKIAVDALKYIGSSIGGSLGERAAGSLLEILDSSENVY